MRQPNGAPLMADVPESWEEAAAALVAQSAPFTDEQRRGLTIVARDFAIQRTSERMVA